MTAPRVTNAVPQGCLVSVIGFGLALMLWPFYVLLHRNERVRLERWER